MPGKKVITKNNIRIGLVQGFYWMASCVFVCFLVRLLTFYGYDDYESGLVLAVSSLATLIIQPLLGDIADHIRSVKRLLICCFIIASTSAWLLSLLIDNRLITCVLIFIIFGAFRSLINIIDLWSINIGKDDVNFSYGFTRSFGAVFYALGAAFFGFAIDSWSPGIIIPCFIALSLLDVVIVYFIKEPQRLLTRQKPLATKKALSLIIGNMAYLGMLFTYLFMEMTVAPMQNYLTRKFEVLGSGDSYTGLSLLIMGFFQLPALLNMDRLEQKFKAQTLMLVSLSGLVLRSLILGFTDIPVVMALSYITEPVSFGLYIGSILLYMRQILPSNVQYLGMTLYAAITAGIGGMLGNYMAGLLSDSFGVLKMMNYITVFSVIALLIFILTMKRKRSDD